MKGALIIALATLLAGLLLWLLDRLRRKPPQPAQPDNESEKCCGLHAVCRKTSLTPTDTTPEYFDDEELDTLAGRDPDTYTPTEREALRDIMLTLPPREAAPWAVSLQLRRIALPPDLRDELLLIVAEQRSQND